MYKNYGDKEQDGKPYGEYNSYFRFKLKLRDDNDRYAGVNIVVGCSVKYSKSIGGGLSVDPGKMSAQYYAKAAPSAHAISILTTALSEEDGPDPCQGDTTSNGNVNKNWLPFVVWYEHAQDLSHGTGYYTKKAYSRPETKLKFISGSIEKANSQDFKEFIKNSPKNLSPTHLAGSLLRVPQLLNKKQITNQMIVDPK